jgi:hypothetical protein
VTPRPEGPAARGKVVSSTLLLITLDTESETVTTGDVGVTKLFIHATQFKCLASTVATCKLHCVPSVPVDDP